MPVVSVPIFCPQSCNGKFLPLINCPEYVEYLIRRRQEDTEESCRNQSHLLIIFLCRTGDISGIIDSMKNLFFDSIYYYSFDIAAMLNGTLLMALILLTRGWKAGFTRSRVTFLLSVNAVISAYLDILTAYFNTTSNCDPDLEEFFEEGGRVFNYLYLMIHNIQPLLFLLYALCVIGRLSGRKKTQRIFLCILPYAVSFVIFNAGLPFGLSISYTLSDGYQHGPLIAVLYIVSVAYLAAVLYTTIHYRRALLQRDMISLSIMVPGAVLAVFLQYALGNILIELFIESLILVALIISMEEQDILYDPDTGLFNLQSFREQTEKLLKGNVRRDLMIVRTSGISNFSRFRSVAAEEQVKRQLAGYIHEATGQEQVYDCGSECFAFYTDPLTDDQLNGFYNASIDRYEKWPEKERISIQLARLHVPEDVTDLESILVFMQSKVSENRQKPHMVPLEEITAIRRKANVEQAVLRGIESHSIETYFQPIMDAGGRIHGAEALSRLRDPVLGQIPPFEFITAAEDNGMIWELGLRTLEAACEVLSILPQEVLHHIDVNLSPVQCAHGGCAAAFGRILDRYGIRPERINFEITESAIIHDRQDFIREKDQLQKAGFRFSIDDYGSGFSNYSYVRTVEPECVKLDRDTLLAADQDERQRRYYIDTVRTLHDIEYKVVAEGVETDAHMAFMKEAGVDYIQGFYYSRPVPQEEFIAYVRGRS